MPKLGVILIIVCFLLFGCSGCAGYNSALKAIPEAGFTSFSYHRGGNVTSADISAKNAWIENGVFHIEEADIKLDYGGAVNWVVHIEGYSRRLPAE